MSQRPPASATSSVAHSTRLSRPWRLTLLVVIAAGLVLVTWQAARLAREQALSSLTDEAHNELRLSAEGLRGHLSRHDYLAEMLASREVVHRFLATPDKLEAMPVNRLLDSVRETADVSDIYLLNRQGDTLAASNWQRPDTFIGQNYRFRDYYQDAVAGRLGRFHGLGTSSKARGYYFSAPIWLANHEAQTADGVMVVKLLLDSVEAAWASQSAELMVTDRDGIIFMASREELRLHALHPLSQAQRQALRDSRRYAAAPLPPAGLETLERRPDGGQIVSFRQGPLAGTPYLRLRREMPEFDWQMHILKPLTPVQTAQWQAALLAGGLYGMVAMAGGYGWQRRRLRREREQFADRERRTLARARDELERNVERRTRDLVDSNRRLSDEIEERRRAEQSLRQTRDELVQAAKLAVLGQLAAGINHELNQPLAAVRAYAENARRFLEQGRADTTDANLAQIVELTERMAEISAQLKQFSRPSGDTLTAVSVPACFGYALRLYQARLNEAGVEVIYAWPEAETWVRADLVRLEQVLVNLIGNALQAMSETPAPRLTLAIEPIDDKVRLSVADNGPGIEAAHLARVFEPFFTTKSPGSGLGLGLSISSRIIDDLGGRLTVGNQPQGGAIFTVTLPADTAPRRDTSSLQEPSSHA